MTPPPPSVSSGVGRCQEVRSKRRGEGRERVPDERQWKPGKDTPSLEGGGRSGPRRGTADVARPSPWPSPSRGGASLAFHPGASAAAPRSPRTPRTGGRAATRTTRAPAASVPDAARARVFPLQLPPWGLFRSRDQGSPCCAAGCQGGPGVAGGGAVPPATLRRAAAGRCRSALAEDRAGRRVCPRLGAPSARPKTGKRGRMSDAAATHGHGPAGETTKRDFLKLVTGCCRRDRHGGLRLDPDRLR